jgi:hypothetical protein
MTSGQYDEIRDLFDAVSAMLTTENVTMLVRRSPWMVRMSRAWPETS